MNVSQNIFVILGDAALIWNLVIIIKRMKPSENYSRDGLEMCTMCSYALGNVHNVPCPVPTGIGRVPRVADGGRPTKGG